MTFDPISFPDEDHLRGEHLSRAIAVSLGQNSLLWKNRRRDGRPMARITIALPQHQAPGRHRVSRGCHQADCNYDFHTAPKNTGWESSEQWMLSSWPVATSINLNPKLLDMVDRLLPMPANVAVKMATDDPVDCSTDACFVNAWFVGHIRQDCLFGVHAKILISIS